MNTLSIEKAKENLAKAKAEAKQAKADLKAFQQSFEGQLQAEARKAKEKAEEKAEALTEAESLLSGLGKGAPSAMVEKAKEQWLSPIAKAEAKAKAKAEALATMNLKAYVARRVDKANEAEAIKADQLAKAKAKVKETEEKAKAEGFEDVIPSAEYKALNSKQRRLVAFVFNKEGLPLSAFKMSSGTFDGNKSFTLVK